jgi:hypothetical protein
MNHNRHPACTAHGFLLDNCMLAAFHPQIDYSGEGDWSTSTSYASRQEEAVKWRSLLRNWPDGEKPEKKLSIIKHRPVEQKDYC